MDIIKTNVAESNKALLYKLTRASGEMVQNIPTGTVIDLQAFCLYNDEKQARDGSIKTNTVLSFVDKQGRKFSTISSTFIREFLYIDDLMGSEPYKLMVIQGTTKGGKPFVTCELNCD